jgi:exodeoxyribonuclease-3
MKILSWNVNGIRSVYKKGFLEWMASYQPDILCLQETKAHLDQLPKDLTDIEGYHTYYHLGERKGYCGVGIITKTKPVEVLTSIENKDFDKEGRVQIADFGEFVLFNVYFPNGKASKERLSYKMGFYEYFLQILDKYKDRKILICGDVNTAHKEIDLARPKENAKVSGFLPEERLWIDKLLSLGYKDTLRMYTDENASIYTWWDQKTRARERNVGWRIDYFFANDNMVPYVKDAFVLSEIMGSDHCPIGVEISL